MRKRIDCAIAVLLLAITVSGCVAPDSRLNDGTTGSDFRLEEMREYQPPDPLPPEARIGETDVPLSSGRWRIDGTLESFVPQSELDVPVTSVTIGGDRLDVLVTSPVEPMDLRFRSFYDLRDGIPSSDVPDIEFRCASSPQSECLARIADGNLVISVDADLILPGVHVLEAVYPTQEIADREEGVAHYSASWAIRTR